MSFLLGAAVMLGWHLRLAQVVQVRPTYTPMVYNTALCLVLGGFALCALASGRRRPALLCGALIGAAGLLNVLEHLLEIDLGIDRLFVEPYITVLTPYPGRMAPNAALCFVSAGLALVFLGHAGQRSRRVPAAGLLGALVAGVAAAGFAGYLTGIEIAYGWGSIPIAVHSAFGLSMLGCGLMAQAWHAGALAEGGSPRWLAVVPGAGVAALALGQAHAALTNEYDFLPAVILGSGLLTALFLSLALYYAQRARRREGEAREAYEALARGARERLSTAEALRSSEERLGRVVEMIADGVFIVDATGQIVFANAMAEKLVGLSRKVITQRAFDAPAWELRTLDDEPFPPEKLPVAEVLRTGEAVYDREFVLRRPDGSSMVASVNAAPLRDAHGAVEGVVASLSDATRRKELEQIKDAFVSTVSHELRTPLASLRGFTELMLGRSFSPEKQREFLGIIHAESVRLGRLIDDFLDVQRFEGGQVIDNLQVLDLGPLLAATQALFGAGRHVLYLQETGPLPAVRGEPDRLRQVLGNLISNAQKFAPAGSTITVSAREVEGEVVVSVADQGIGMDARTLERLFTKFFRADSEHTRRVGGTGLGLALVREIVNAHGGKVWVESELGRGSTFFFSLPAVTSLAAPPSSACDVLVVEDDAAFARLLQERLSADGLRVMVQPTGEDALQTLRSSSVRLAILDIHLAGQLDGWDVLTEVKSDARLAELPLMVLSASETINRRGLALAGADYLLKPIGMEPLARALLRCLPPGGSRRILVVDDDPRVFQQVAECMRGQPDVQLEHAANGTEALERLARAMPELLVLDLLMPEVDGFEILARLRRDRRAANLAVLVLTGKHLSRSDKARLKLRMGTLVRKQGVSPEFIVDTVQQMLGARTDLGSAV